jgi:hypothetical protein
MIYNENNKHFLFYLIKLARVSPFPQEQINLLTHKGMQHQHGNKMDGVHGND